MRNGRGRDSACSDGYKPTFSIAPKTFGGNEDDNCAMVASSELLDRSRRLNVWLLVRLGSHALAGCRTGSWASSLLVVVRTRTKDSRKKAVVSSDNKSDEPALVRVRKPTAIRELIK